MPNVTAIQTTFTRGEASPKIKGRPDTQAYNDAVAICENMIVMPHGGARKRPGTMFVAEVKNSEIASRIVPFQFNTEQAYVLEFAHNCIRVVRDHGLIFTSPARVFPTVNSITTTAFAVDATSHLVAMPATAATGDLLLTLFTWDGGGPITTPSGWTLIQEAFSSGAGGVAKSGIFARISDGTEGGTTVDFVTGSTQEASAHVYRILAANWYGSIAEGIAVGPPNSGDSANPNPPSLTPPWGDDLTLWLSFSGSSSNNASVSSFPTNYTNGTYTKSSTGNFTSGNCASAERALQTATEDPGVFTLSGVVTWTAHTIAIRPAGLFITGITQANPGVVTTNAAHGFSNGKLVAIDDVVGMTEVNGANFTIANVTATTFELSGVDTTGFGAYVSGGEVSTPVEVATTYTDLELKDLDFAQRADTLYNAHKKHAIAKLTRSSHTSWALADAAIERGPFGPINGDTTWNMVASGGTPTIYGTYAEGATGITLTSDQAIFTAAMVGSLVRLWENGKTSGAADNPQDGEAIVAGDKLTHDGKVYGFSAVSGPWDASYPLPTHESGSVILRDTQESKSATALFLHELFCIVTITGFTSSTVVTVTISVHHLPESVIAGTSFWELGAWNNEFGFPGKITFHEQRLWAASSPNDPQTLWASVSGGFENFRDGADDDRALIYELASGSIDEINWLQPGQTLTIGTASGEYSVSPSSRNEALTPSNVNIRRQTSHGSAKNVRPIAIGNSVLFGQRHGDPDNPSRKIRELQYSFDLDAYTARDVTIFSEHITGDGVIDLAYQQAPDGLVWGARDDGFMASFTLEREQEVFAWHRHWLGGYSDAGKTVRPVVESMAVIPGPDGDEIYFVVRRHINGSVKRYIEYLTIGYDRESDDKDDMVYLDSALSYDVPLPVTGATAADPVVVSAPAHGFTNGKEVRVTDILGMTELNGNYYFVADQTLNDFALVERSVAASIVGATQANPVVISTQTAHGLANGNKVALLDAAGMTELNGLTYTLANVTATTFELQGIDGTAFTAYISGGQVYNATDGSAFTAYISGGEVAETVSIITGLDHLEGEIVGVLGDGVKQADKTVVNGSITLGLSAARVIVGLPYMSTIAGLEPEFGAVRGTAQTRPKNISDVFLRVWNSRGGKIGKSTSDAVDIIHRTNGGGVDASLDLKTGDVRATHPTGWDRDANWYVEHSDPYPFTLLAVIYELSTSG